MQLLVRFGGWVMAAACLSCSSESAGLGGEQLGLEDSGLGDGGLVCEGQQETCSDGCCSVHAVRYRLTAARGCKEKVLEAPLCYASRGDGQCISLPTVRCYKLSEELWIISSAMGAEGVLPVCSEAEQEALTGAPECE